MKIPATREKNLWYPGYSGCNITYFAETKHEEIKTEKVMITDKKKAVSFYPFLFYKAFCNTTEFASGQNKPNPILACSDFPRLSC